MSQCGSRTSRMHPVKRSRFTDSQAHLEKLLIATLLSLRKFTHNRHIFFSLAKEVRGQTHMPETGTSGNNNI